MVDLGWFDGWRPRSGQLTTWTVLSSARSAMLQTPACTTPVRGWQQRYLRATHRLAGTNCPHVRLRITDFGIAGRPDIAAMTRAITELVRRHDSFRTWFSVEPDGRVLRHLLAPEEVELVATARGDLADGRAISAAVRADVPDALHWDCFGFGVIEHEHSFTTYVAVDRLHSDTATTATDLQALYETHTYGSTRPGTPTAEVVRRHTNCYRTVG